MTKFRVAAILILLVGIIGGMFAAADFFSVPSWASAIQHPYRLGLDLKGGTHLVYLANLEAIEVNSRDEAMESLKNVIERRVNLFGVAEPVVQVEQHGEEYRLIVELAGIKDIREAIRLIGETPSLEFKEARKPEETEAIPASQKEGESLDLDPYFSEVALDGRYLKRAQLEFDPSTNTPYISVEFNDEGARAFEALTERNIGKPIGIFLDGVLLSAPTVQEKITGGKAQITGQFSVEEARDLVRRLNSGALPVPITLVSQQSIEAGLGAEYLAKSLRALLFGFAAVALFMIFWYRLPGVIAVIALLIYAAITLSVSKLIPVTLTAAGIAGFILSLGMAVDANILIFERMKEELRQGKSLRQAIDEGFRRAWTSIRDSNIASLITAAILYWLGTSLMKGFALTLAIGVMVSMFSAISVSRTFLLVVATRALERKKLLFLSGVMSGMRIKNSESR